MLIRRGESQHCLSEQRSRHYSRILQGEGDAVKHPRDSGAGGFFGTVGVWRTSLVEFVISRDPKKNLSSRTTRRS